MKIITTVGTSLIINSNVDCESLESEPFDEKYFIDSDSFFKKYIRPKEEELSTYLCEKGNSACAELASLDQIGTEYQLRGNAEIYLLCTETINSYMCGRVLKKHLEERAHLDYIKDLKIDNPSNFENGVFNLMDKISVIFNQNAGFSNADQLILNISGGYKALIPYLTILGQLFKIPLIYIYEDSPELITIKQYPLDVDWSLLEQYSSFLTDPNLAEGGNLENLQKLGLMKPNSKEMTILGNVLAKYILNNDQPFAASTIGYMIEYKIFKFLLENTPNRVDKIVHGLKSRNPEEGFELDDIDIWMSLSGKEGIGVEIKSLDKKPKEILKALKRHEKIVSAESLKVKEYWLILYSFDSKDNSKLKRAHECLNRGELSYPVIIKYVQLDRNKVDGRTNRFNQHEFWRSEISKIEDFQ